MRTFTIFPTQSLCRRLKPCIAPTLFPLLLIFVGLSALMPARQALAEKPLKHLLIYSIDVEGGQATLFVGPSGASLLVDTGWPGNEGRDAQRIQAAMQNAGIDRIDHVLITHYHDDHVGGVAELVKKVQVGEFIDHGPNHEDSEVTRANYAAYEAAIQGKPRRTVHPGDTIDIPGVNVLVVTADGDHIGAIKGNRPLPNPFCGLEPKAPADATENARSIGIVVTFGKFRAVDLADLTKAKEAELMCPNNPIGTVDLYIASHHGLNQSNSSALVDALHPRVAIINNGPHKGGSPEAWQIMHESPGLEDVFQLHSAEDTDETHNTQSDLIANIAGGSKDGFNVKVDATPDATFAVTNARNHQTTEYLHK